MNSFQNVRGSFRNSLPRSWFVPPYTKVNCEVAQELCQTVVAMSSWKILVRVRVRSWISNGHARLSDASTRVSKSRAQNWKYNVFRLSGCEPSYCSDNLFVELLWIPVARIAYSPTRRNKNNGKRWFASNNVLFDESEECLMNSAVSVHLIQFSWQIDCGGWCWHRSEPELTLTVIWTAPIVNDPLVRRNFSFGWWNSGASLVSFVGSYEDLSFNSETGHDRKLVQLLHNVTHFVPKQTVKQWKLCQRASTCANVPIMTSLRIKW